MSGVPLTFFIDRGLGKRIIADALRKSGEVVEIHDDHFEQDAEDVAWLPIVARKGWLILTKDEALARNTAERAEIKRVGARIFLFAHGSASGQVMVQGFMNGLSAMKSFAQENHPPFIAKVYRDGTVKAWKSAAEL